MCFTPLIDAISSSIGSRISFSTPSGDAPGYGMPTMTTGGATSGNSSVLSLSSANKPNTTSATIETTVISGRLIAKSDMNILNVPELVVSDVTSRSRTSDSADQQPDCHGYCTCIRFKSESDPP